MDTTRAAGLNAVQHEVVRCRACPRLVAWREQVATEKGLHVVFSVRDSGIVWADSGVDLSAEVIKRFDAAPKTAPKK